MVDLRTVLNITNVSTNSVSSGTDYATTLSVDNDDLQLNAEQVTFSDIKTNLAIINDNLSVQEYSDEETVHNAILYFSPFIYWDFEPDVLWTLLSRDTNEQINISHLTDAFSSVGGIEGIVGSKFLRKDVADTANGTIYFRKGLKYDGDLRTYTYREGILDGVGMNIDGEGNGEMESLILRSFLEVPELRFNRVDVVSGELWNSPSFGTIETVDTENLTATLKLEDDEYGTPKAGDIMRGIFNNIAQLSAANDSSGIDDCGFNRTVGFFTSYFTIKTVLTNEPGKFKFLYALKPNTVAHPCAQMKFACYGSFSDKDRRASAHHTKTYTRYLRNVQTWKITNDNIASQFGLLDGLEFEQADGKIATLKGYGSYQSDNVYINGALIGIKNVEELKKQFGKYGTYSIHLGSEAETIDADSEGNIVGGLATVSAGSTTTYRLQSPIYVTKEEVYLTEADVGGEEGTYYPTLQTHGCTAKIESGCVIITAIDNFKDGIANEEDLQNFDYDLMRNTKACSVDVLVNCEGNVVIYKTYNITINHIKIPYVSADISNESIMVSYDKLKQQFIGLPATFEIRMWKGEEELPITSVVVGSNDNFTYTGVFSNSNKLYTATITKVVTGIPNSSIYRIICQATYAGVSYERTLTFSIIRRDGLYVYQLKPSVSSITAVYNGSTWSYTPANVSCLVVQTDSKNSTELTNDDCITSGLTLQYKIDTNGALDYTYNSNVNTQNVEDRITFSLYLNGDNIDNEDVPINKDGKNGTYTTNVYYNSATKPQTPSGTLSEVLLAGWTTSIVETTTGQYTWLSTSLYDGYSTYSSWSVPIRVSGADGNNGADGTDYEYIYKSTTTSDQLDTPYSNPTVDDYVPAYWSDSPSGVTETNMYEWVCVRTKQNGTWGTFTAPVIWSSWGVKGTDGDGIEYVFRLTTTKTAPTIDATISQDNDYVPVDWSDNPLSVTTDTRYEWVSSRKKNNGTWSAFSTPALWTMYGIDGSNTEFIYRRTETDTTPDTPVTSQADDYVPAYWTDDPTGVSSTYMYEWVCTRTKVNSIWSDYSTPALWAKYGEKGDKGDKGEIGPQGENGIAGTNGTNGQTTYFHVKYSDYSDGTNMNESGGAYIGTYVDYTLTDSTNKSDYTWVEIKGAQGEKGDRGIAGVDGSDGTTYYLHIAYANSSDGSVDFSVSNSTDKSYIGVYTDTYYSDSTSYSRYSWSRIKGNDGDPGPSGCITRLSYGLSTSRQYLNQSTLTTSGAKYIDFVAIEGATASGYNVYSLKSSASPYTPTSTTIDTSKWDSVSVNEAAAYFNFLLAANAHIKVLSSAQITVQNSSYTTTGGMQGNTSYPIFWAGSTYENCSSAPFRVLSDGSFTATNATITGTFSMYSDIDNYVDIKVSSRSNNGSTLTTNIYSVSTKTAAYFNSSGQGISLQLSNYSTSGYALKSEGNIRCTNTFGGSIYLEGLALKITTLSDGLVMSNNVDVYIWSGSSSITVWLPTYPVDGKVITVRKLGNGGITVKTSKNMITGFNSYTTSVSLVNGEAGVFRYSNLNIAGLWIANREYGW